MNAQADDWNDFRFLLAVSRAGSLAAASREMRVHHSTVLRRIRGLEAKYGTLLFERAPDGYKPTETARTLLDTAEEMEGVLYRLDRNLASRNDQLAGMIRFTTVETLLDAMMPAIADFMTAHPAIQVECATAYKNLNLSRRDADVAIRATDEPPDNLVGRRLCGIGWAIYGLKGRDYGPLEKADWLAFAERQAQFRASRWLSQTYPNARIRFRAANLLGIIAALREGLGVAVLPCFMGDAEPGLARLGGLIPDLGSGLWILTHDDLRKVPRIRAFMSHMGAAICERRLRFEGE